MRRTLSLVALGVLLAAPLLAQDSLETAKRKELDELNRQAHEKREAARQLKGQESQALVQLHRTEKELNGTRRRLKQLESRRHNLDQQLQVTRVDSNAVRAHCRARRRELASAPACHLQVRRRARSRIPALDARRSASCSRAGTSW